MSTCRVTECQETLLRDSDIRVALRDHLTVEHGAGALILDELGLACSTARVDVAVVNGAMSGFEIKSDVDSLTRLPGQVAAYDSILDYATLVVGRRHFDHASEMVPRHWGLIRAEKRDGDLALVDVRPAVRNRALAPRSLAMMLWRDELVEELKARSAYRGLSAKPKGALWDALVGVTTVEELRDVVRERIRARGDWRAAAPRA